MVDWEYWWRWLGFVPTPLSRADCATTCAASATASVASTRAPVIAAAILASPEPQPSSSTASVSPSSPQSQLARLALAVAAVESPATADASKSSANMMEVPHTHSQRSHCCFAYTARRKQTVRAQIISSSWSVRQSEAAWSLLNGGSPADI